MMFRKFLSVLFVIAFMFSVVGPFAVADDYDFAYKRLGEMETLTEAGSDDLFLVYDESAKAGKTMDAANPVISGDLTFQSTLLTNGRVNAVLTLQSSSTEIAETNVPYSVILKIIGSTGGLDETDGGIRLADAKAGQVLVISIIGPEGSGDLVITPVTATGFTTLTFDTVLDSATLMYFNDTLGWVVISTTSVTVA